MIAPFSASRLIWLMPAFRTVQPLLSHSTASPARRVGSPPAAPTAFKSWGGGFLSHTDTFCGSRSDPESRSTKTSPMAIRA